MNNRQTVVAAYNASEEASDGLTLARLLAARTDRALLIARVLDDRVRAAELDPETQRAIRARVGETRRAIVAALPDETQSPGIVPVLNPDVARGLHDVARANDASLLVLGSSHHSRLGRMLLGGTADAVVEHAPCPIAVAPPLFRDALGLSPEVIGCAYDGTVASVDALLAATDLALTFEAPLQVLAVARDDVAAGLFDDARALVREAAGNALVVECVTLEGDPAHALLGYSDGHIGLLVMGSRDLGPIRRALLGSVSTKVLRDATCPVVVVPRRG